MVFGNFKFGFVLLSNCWPMVVLDQQSNNRKKLILFGKHRRSTFFWQPIYLSGSQIFKAFFSCGCVYKHSHITHCASVICLDGRENIYIFSHSPSKTPILMLGLALFIPFSPYKNYLTGTCSNIVCFILPSKVSQQIIFLTFFCSHSQCFLYFAIIMISIIANSYH